MTSGRNPRLPSIPELSSEKDKTATLRPPPPSPGSDSVFAQFKAGLQRLQNTANEINVVRAGVRSELTPAEQEEAFDEEITGTIILPPPEK